MLKPAYAIKFSSKTHIQLEFHKCRIFGETGIHTCFPIGSNVDQLHVVVVILFFFQSKQVWTQKCAVQKTSVDVNISYY